MPENRPSTRTAWPRRLMLRAAGLFLRPLIRVTTAPDAIAGIGIAPDVPVVYALQVRRLSALFALQDACAALGLVEPLAPLALDGHRGPVRERSAFFFLTRAGQPSPRQQRPYRYSRRLHRLVDAALEDGSLQFQIVPVSIFWGRAPEKQDSVIKALFADSWAVPGPLRQLIRLVLHGRQTLVHFGAPMSMQDLVDDGERATALRRVARRLRAHFRAERERVVGPNLSHRHTVINAVIDSDAVRFAIAQEAKRSGKPAEKLEVQARRHAYEIASDYSYAFIRAFDIALTALWNRIYDGVDVTRAAALATLAPNTSIVYVPCHRSHIDYLLLSYVLYHRGLPPPHVAAGDNLDLPVVGGVLRRVGAFFLRRSFQGERIYTRVFYQYLQTMISRGFAIEYFVEAGRSRTGFMLQPKSGLVAMTLESWLRERTRPLAFVPVYIGYEKLLEGASYVAELSGQPKRRESLWGLVRSIRKLREHCGRVHVNFGEPIAIDAFLDAQWPRWQLAADAGEIQDEPALREAVSALTRRIVTEINAAVVVNPVNLLALALLGTPRNAMDAVLLERQLETLVELLRRQPYAMQQQISSLPARELIDYGERTAMLERVRHPLGDMIRVHDAHAILLNYYRNNVLHAFALPALIARLVDLNEGIAYGRVERVARMLFPFLKAELFLHGSEAELAPRLAACCDALCGLGLIERSGDWLYAAPAGAAESMMLHGLGENIRQPVERYFIVVGTLVRAGSGSISPKQLEDTALSIAERSTRLHAGLGPQFADRGAFRASVETLLATQMAVSVDDRVGFGEALEASAGDAPLLLPADTRRAIAHDAVHSLAGTRTAQGRPDGGLQCSQSAGEPAPPP
ncbi:MAG: glycerol-3-phosphate 1-O-acyltransferase PlsB [Burkholderiaceae bacterium]